MTPLNQPNSSLTSPEKSALLQDVEINGSLTFKGDLYFDGKLKGAQIEGDLLTLGQHANIEGNIKTDHLTVEGAVKGDVTVTEKCHLRSTATLEGALKTSRLVMDEGATLVGNLEIGPKPSNVVELGAARKSATAAK